MVKIIRGKAGSAVKGDVVQLSEDVEKRLIHLGMAKEVTEEQMSDSDILPEPGCLTQEELKKIRSKKDMMNYAASIGCELDEGMSLKEMLNAVLNHQEENENFNENFGGPDV